MRPSRHSAIGVDQYQICDAYSSSPAWNASHDPSERNSHAASFDGASPKYSVAAAFGSGLAM